MDISTHKLIKRRKENSMTDKEKLEKVKAEIERLKEIAEYNLSHSKMDRSAWMQQAACCTKLLSFIDSMQEECNIIGIKSKHATGKLKECIDNITEESLAKARKQLQEPVSKDLEKAAQEYAYQRYDEDCRVYGYVELAFKAGANWQKEQDKQWLAEEHKNIFAKGRDSMKQQMMKEAVKINISNASIVSLPVNCNLKVGDKVLIIKDE